jgi:DNA-binding MarR family transcriptional regulator
MPDSVRQSCSRANDAVDELLLSKIRLSIIAELLSSDWVAFSALQRAVQTTNGNLGAHLGKLVDADYVAEEKSFVDRRPQSRYRLTQTGRDAFATHVRDLQQLLGGTRS